MKQLNKPPKKSVLLVFACMLVIPFVFLYVIYYLDQHKCENWVDSTGEITGVEYDYGHCGGRGSRIGYRPYFLYEYNYQAKSYSGALRGRVCTDKKSVESYSYGFQLNFPEIDIKINQSNPDESIPSLYVCNTLSPFDKILTSIKSFFIFDQ